MKYPHVNIVDGLNLTPVPLEFSQSLTTTKWLGSIEKRVNDIIDAYNEQETTITQYTDEEILKIKKEIEKIIRGSYLENGSVTMEKLSNDFITKIDNLVKSKVGDFAKIVCFGLDDDGHFVAYIPQSWNEIEFSTDMEGRLILNY